MGTMGRLTAMAKFVALEERERTERVRAYYRHFWKPFDNEGTAQVVNRDLCR